MNKRQRKKAAKKYLETFHGEDFIRLQECCLRFSKSFAEHMTKALRLVCQSLEKIKEASEAKEKGDT